MQKIAAGLTMVLVLGLAFWLRAGRDRAPEPVAFAAVQPETMGAGGTLTDAWADVDGDGDPDRFVGFNGVASRLYLNGGTAGLTDVAADRGLLIERAVRTSAWGDFDGDGDPDLLLGFAGEAPVTALYRNDGEAGFVETAEAVGLSLGAGVTRQASWVDYDGDDDLDLYLAMRDGPNRLFRNEASSFTDVTEATGIGDARRSVGALWLDYDRDGDLDVVVGNMDGDANGLWRNDGGTFTDVAGDSPVAGGGRGVGIDTQGTVRPCTADVNGDGLFDLFFANYGPNELLLAEEAGGWQPAGEATGLAIDSRYDTCTWGDFDHDGRIDLFVNGTVSGGTQYRDWLFRREGAEAFVDVSPPELLGLNADHGATWVDFDMDGDLDLGLTGAPEDGTHVILKNLLRPEFGRHSLSVRVLDDQGRATRPGAEIRLYAAGTDRLVGTGLVDSGSGYDAQSDLPVHFGLPGAQPVDVEVTWPSGGSRGVMRADNVDPADFRGRSLEVRVARGG